jgi:CheY-like chemotaxis protein
MAAPSGFCEVRLLIIDDEQDFTDTLLARFGERDLALEVTIARSKESALSSLADELFDFIICDLRIPTVDRALDADRVHGQSVYTTARAEIPGTPILVLSAYGDEQLVADMAELAPHDDPFGSGTNKPMLQYVTKHSDLEGCLTRVADAAGHTASLRQLNLSPIPEHLELSDAEERLVRIFARQKGGAVARFRELGGGLSDSRVLWLRIEDYSGALAALAVAKIDSLPEISEEVRRYDEYVSGLTPGIFTPLIKKLTAGAGRFGGAFYGLDEGFDRSLFELAVSKPGNAARGIDALREGTSRWRNGRPTTALPVAAIRRRSVCDARVDLNVRQKLTGLGWELLEQREIQARPCPQHCDLHGLNVLTTQDGNSRMIDFASVGEATAAVDPVTLELSILFHPRGPAVDTAWPSVDQAAAWGNRPVYLDGCPFAEYVQHCRDWAFGVAASNDEVFATVYAYAMRQLSYPYVDDDLALALIRCCIDALSS